MNIQPQDQAFYDQCKAWLDKAAESFEAPYCPVFFNADGSLDRERMLELPCYADSGIAQEEGGSK